MLFPRISLAVLVTLSTTSCGAFNTLFSQPLADKPKPVGEVEYESPGNALECRNAYRPIGQKIGPEEILGFDADLVLEKVDFYLELRSSVEGVVANAVSSVARNESGSFTGRDSCLSTKDSSALYPGYVHVPEKILLPEKSIERGLGIVTYMGSTSGSHWPHAYLEGPAIPSLVEWFKEKVSWDALEIYRNGDQIQAVHSYQDYWDPPEAKDFEFYIATYRIVPRD